MCLSPPELPREVCGICYKCFDTRLVLFRRDRLERLRGVRTKFGSHQARVSSQRFLGLAVRCRSCTHAST